MVLLEELGRGEQVGSPRGTRRAEGAEETQPSEKTGKEEEWGVIPGETLRRGPLESSRGPGWPTLMSFSGPEEPDPVHPGPPISW